MHTMILPAPLDLSGPGIRVDLRLTCTTDETKFVIELSGWGFEARRTLDRADLLDIKDWIKERLGEAE